MKQKKCEVFIHVGYPKCASTFLQHNVFPYLKNVHFIHKRMKNLYHNEYPHFVSLCRLHPGKNLISSEQLTGSVSVHDHHASGMVMADRLHRLYPSAKIMLIRRETDSWLRSLYQQFMVDAGKNIRINGFDDWYRNHLNHDILCFDEYEQHLRSLFDDVLVLSFEELKKDNDVFIQRICDFMGVSFPDEYVRKKAMVGLKPKHLRLVRLMGRFGWYRFNRFYLLGLLRRLNQ